MLSVWSNDYNVIILNVGVLLLFFRWVLWVRCNVHDGIGGPHF